MKVCVVGAGGTGGLIAAVLPARELVDRIAAEYEEAKGRLCRL